MFEMRIHCYFERVIFFFLSRMPYFLLVNGISNKLHASFKKETDNHELN